MGRVLRSARGLDRARIDHVVAAVLGLTTQLQVWLSSAVHDRVAAAIAAIILCSAVAVRRRRPLAAALAGAAAVSGEAAFGGALVQHSVTALPAGILLFYGAGAFLAPKRSIVALLASVAGLLPQILLGPNKVSNLFFEPVVLVFVPWLCGRWQREWAQRAVDFRELSERLDAERERDSGGAVDTERMRVARELHDVIGHCLAVIVLQAGGARMLVDTDPERAGAAMHVVERAGHEALAEIRRLMTMFDTSEAGSISPQPSLASIEELVARTSAAGLQTELEIDGTPTQVSPALALCAYRIVQEGLTNTIKHAGPARASVRMSWGDDRLEVEVEDNGRGPVQTDDADSGHGIIGMRERVALHRGVVRIERGSAGGCLLHATLPLEPETAR
jgi:signal transduction histidine kinase